jgi:hypothetical protein
MWGQTRTLTNGILGEIRDNGGLTALTLREHVERGARLLVPIDRTLSPWPVPRLFELSRKQALDLLAAIGPESETRITYVVRSDGSIALIRRDDAYTGADSLPVGGSDTLQGT